MTVTFDTLKAATRLARKPASPKGRRPRFQTATEQRSDRLSQQPAPRLRAGCDVVPPIGSYTHVVVTVYLLLALDGAIRSPMAKGLVEVMYHAMSRTAAVGTALAAVIVGFEGVTMTFLKREREEGRREGRHEGRHEGRREGRREGMRERDREWKDWQERLKKDPNAEPPPPPKDDD